MPMRVSKKIPTEIEIRGSFKAKVMNGMIVNRIKDYEYLLLISGVEATSHSPKRIIITLAPRFIGDYDIVNHEAVHCKLTMDSSVRKLKSITNMIDEVVDAIIKQLGINFVDEIIM